jgi:hypothetical protein
MGHCANVAGRRRELLDVPVVLREPPPQDVHHPEDDVELILHHQGERLAPNREQGGIRGCDRGRRPPQVRKQGQLAEEVAGSEHGDLALVAGDADAEAHSAVRDDEHVVAGVALAEDHVAGGYVAAPGPG